MTEHTPGPWTVDDGINVVHRYTTPERGPGYEVAGIAKVTYAAARTEANAYLIAAAPDLLAALEAMLRSTNTFEALGEWEALDINPRNRREQRAKVDAITARAIAAIAKARGEVVD